LIVALESKLSGFMTEAEKATTDAAEDRRQALKKLGRFSALTAPAIILLLSAGTKPAKAVVLSPIVY
jgi:hypothetical protein